MASVFIRWAALSIGMLGLSSVSLAQPVPPATAGWQSCQALADNPAAQLRCFQDWAATQTTNPPADASRSASPAASALAAPEGAPPPVVTPKLVAATPIAPDGKPVGCRDEAYSELSRFWELQRGSNCGGFGLRPYRPNTLAVAASDGVNLQPSPTLAAQALQRYETKLQVSVRSKVAANLLTNGTRPDDDRDSLWFGYTQQNYWQIFNGKSSRPFRSNDYEPELIYIYPHQLALPGGFSYRLSGVGLVHQSNGQSDPLSRSWNRVYVMGAVEKKLGPNSHLTLQARLWRRLPESDPVDDNPEIENFVGRAEAVATWQVDKLNTLGLTLRHALRSPARGSVKLDWMLAPPSAPDYAGLRYHLEFFSGYGDSLIDYNRRRNVLSVGVSLVDW